ncbi:MAG: 16S rRNA (guanine(527)-N(7))-methyltransferase RsmG [Bacteroidales bacterium]|nr:16S rRNA (guanine(527)-N(7))-methyltransferase RsmG [Bacteroidales bacterium]
MQIIEKYFPSLSVRQQERFEKLGPLYRKWNKKINVISRKDIDQLYLRHVLHSLSIAKYTLFSSNMEVLDVGTGGGFPGIPLAILFPEVHFTLVDSIQKKINVVQAVIDALELNNTKTSNIRAEKIKEKYDVFVCRAVAPLSTLIRWTRKNAVVALHNDSIRGLIALKGGDLSEETDTGYNTKIIEIMNLFEEPFFRDKKIVHVTYG